MFYQLTVIMFKPVCVLVLAVICTCRGGEIPGVKTTETYDHSAILDEDGNYILFWKFNDTHIVFESHVRTKGWVGLGLSGNGNMYPGDVAIGWVQGDGTVQFSDRHTDGHVMPKMDQTQDWHLLYGEENDFGTVLKMVRKLITCDTAEDLDIQEGTNRMIFAYGDHDPANEHAITYHGTNRGTKSVSLLSDNAIPSDLGHVKHYDFFNSNVMVPSDTTTYWCKGFKMPAIGKHHMIKYEAVVTPGNELNVHHILLYRCNIANADQYDGVSTNCYKKSRTLPGCSDVIIAWAIGGEPFFFPDNVGFSFGGPDDDTFFIMETHFDNPNMRTDMIDDSGIRVTLTTDLRPFEAGMLELGMKVNTFQVIPPGEKEFTSKGYCHELCLTTGFHQSNLTEIKIFGALQHSHLLGVAITTRHYRNGVEIKPLITDPNYDFDFQEFRKLPKEVSVYPGDSFRVDCTYDSRGRTGATYGGLSTQEEMCLTFAYHYPKLSVAKCISMPLLDTFYHDTEHIRSYIHRLDWSNQTIVDKYKKSMETTKVYQECNGEHLKAPHPAPSRVFTPHEPSQHYTPPPPDCS